MSEWRLDVDSEGDLADVVTTNEAYPDELLVIAEFTDPSDAAKCVAAVNGQPAMLAELATLREALAKAREEVIPGLISARLAAEREVERLTKELADRPLVEVGPGVLSIPDMAGLAEALRGGDERATLEARLAAAERARDEAVGALRLAEPYLAYAAEPEPCYGSFHGGDPRDFTPDPECSTEEEREKHRRACEVWEAQAEPMALRDTHSLVKNEAGEVVGHVARSGFGLGTYLRRDKRAVQALDAARRALDDGGKP